MRAEMMLRHKIRWFTYAGVAVCFMAAMPALYLLHKGLIHQRADFASDLMASTLRVLGEYNAKAERGDFTMVEARRQSITALHILESDTFHITLFTDGEIPPDWPGWPGGGRAVVAQGTFAPWGWALAAAVHVDDLEQNFHDQLLAFTVFLLVLFVLSWPFSAFLSEQVVGPIEGLSTRMGQLTRGQADIDVPGCERTDEFGEMARALDYFRCATGAIIERDERLSGIMNNVEEAIVLVSESGLVEEHNRQALVLFGADVASGLVGRPFAGLFIPDVQDSVVHILATRSRAAGASSYAPDTAPPDTAPPEAAPPDTAPPDTDPDDGAAPRGAPVLAVDHDGVRVDVSLTVSVMEVQSRHSFICVLADITDRMHHERELVRLATRDRLTGLPNRTLMETLTERALARAQRYGRRCAVLCLDLSRFRLITDTLGHRAGDQLLIAVAARIQEVVRTSDSIGRIGSDDFAIILEEILDANEAAVVSQRIIDAFEAPVPLLGSDYYVRPSLGIALFPEHADDAAELIRAADTALYTSKRLGGRRYTFFSKEMSRQAHRHLALDRDLRTAIAQGQFRLYYQPKVALADLTLEGFEALLRWEKPGHGMVPPGEFIPVAEETGFIVPLGDWVLNEACRQLRAWQDAGLDPVPVAVNISPRQMRQRSAEDFRLIVNRHGLEPRLIEVEITEGAVMQDIDHALTMLKALKESGIRVAVDDFGTGHSSLSYLKRLPVSSLKIDRSFVNGLPDEREDAGIVVTIINMAEMLNLTVIAEGVERPEQAAFLRENNCASVQGWLTGRPMPAEQAAELLARRLAPSDPVG
jgi:diguanylate cyclase (GGDEF)-like protein